MINCILFLDRWLIDDMRDVVHCFGRPKIRPTPHSGDEFCNPMMVERTGGRWPAEWRMYYSRALHQEEITEPGRNPRAHLCLAESDDGVEWRRATLPDDYRPVKDLPNAVADEFIKIPRWDPWDPNPQRRYKAHAGSLTLKSPYSMITGCSPDGVRWTFDDRKEHCWYTREGGNDGTRTPFYNPITGKWQFICRPYCPDRRVATTWSDDFQTWSDPLTILQPDSLDRPGTQFYGLNVWPYGVTNGIGQPEDFEGCFVAMLNVYRTSTGDETMSWSGDAYVELAYSFNGIGWNRTDRRPFFDLDDHGDQFGSWLNAPSLMGYDEDENLRFVFYGRDFSHGLPPDGMEYREGDCTLGYATLRKDGLAYLRSIGVGYLRLKPMHPIDGSLNINFKAPRGRVRVQASHPNVPGDRAPYGVVPYDGFTFDDCIPLEGDELHAPVRWREKTPRDLVGEDCYLEFELYDAQLYAVRWNCSHFSYADAPVHDLR